MKWSRVGLLTGLCFMLAVSSVGALNNVLSLSRPSGAPAFVETLLTDKTVRTEPTLPTYSSLDGQFITFTSNMDNAAGRRDVFVVKIQPAPTS